MSAALSKKAKREGFDAFAEAVRKRQNPMKVARDLANGRFATGGPSQEPEVIYHYVETLQALRRLQEPLEVLMLALAREAEDGDESLSAMLFLGSYVQAFHKIWAEAYKGWLKGGDPYFLQEALKGPPFKPAFPGDEERRADACRALLAGAEARGLLATVGGSEGRSESV